MKKKTVLLLIVGMIHLVAAVVILLAVVALLLCNGSGAVAGVASRGVSPRSLSVVRVTGTLTMSQDPPRARRDLTMPTTPMVVYWRLR